MRHASLATGYAYDGLGRRATTTDATRYGTDTTRTVYNGASPAQEAAQAHGTTTLVRDAAGRLAQHVTGSGEATYMNSAGDTISPLTGRVISRTDPFAHIPLK